MPIVSSPFSARQAEVARQFRLDRAVVNNWVKSGYVPARWAMEVEQATDGQIAAVEVLNEATVTQAAADEIAPGRREPVRIDTLQGVTA